MLGTGPDAYHALSSVEVLAPDISNKCPESTEGSMTRGREKGSHIGGFLVRYKDKQEELARTKRW